MTVTQHTVADLFILLSASLLCGVMLSCIYILFLCIPSIIQACKCRRFPSYTYFCNSVSTASGRCSSRIVTDVLVCILVAFSVLLVSFLFNSGNFRFSSVASILIGFIAGYYLFGKIIRFFVLNMVFLIKWVINILAYPFVRIVSGMSRLIVAMYKNVSARRVDKMLEKHTEYRFSQIEKDTEYGLIDKYYKELIK